jgi:elongation factor 2
VECIYDGPIDDPYATAMRNCDADGPLMVYIVKLVPGGGDQAGRLYALGRVFSGKVTPGAKVRIRCSEERSDGIVKSLHRTGLWVVKALEGIVDGVPCGNIVALSGVDGIINKTATITGEKDHAAKQFKKLMFPVAPFVRVSVSSQDLKRLRKAIELLSKSDTLVECVYAKSSREYVISCIGDLHLKACLNDLKKQMSGVNVVVGAPVVQYRETVVGESNRAVVTRSQNKLNRMTMVARALDADLAGAISDGRAGDATALQEFGIERDHAKKVWSFAGANILVNTTKGVMYANKARESVVTGFKDACSGGVLAGEPLHGVRVDLTDAVFHSDAAHRGAGQIVAPATRGVHAAQLAASPRLMEPVYRFEVTTPKTYGLYNLLRRRRANILPSSEEGVLSALLPVAESFQLIQDIRSHTAGEASLRMCFEGWRLVESDPLEEGSVAAEIVENIRARKGMGKIDLSLYA